jgi:hypothetical protein
MAKPFHREHPYLTAVMSIIIVLLVIDALSDRFGPNHYHSHGPIGSSDHGWHDDGYRHGMAWRKWAHDLFDGENKGMPGRHCRDGMESWAESRLFMGRGSEDGIVVSEADWEKFLDTEIRKRFPNGFTVIDVGGYWGEGAGASYSEPAKVLLLLHDGSEYDAVNEIGAAFLEQFNQSSVLRTDSFACLKFMG